MDHTTVKTLLEKGETRVLDGFMYRDGRTYKGTLRIEDKELKLDRIADGSSEVASSLPEYEVNPEPIGACPVGCGSEVIETSTHLLCRTTVEAQQEQEKTGEKPKEEPCRFILPRTVCKREIVRDEAETYVLNKRTAMLEEFTSRYGRPFSATLFVKENGRHGFEFAPRKGGAKKTGRKKTSTKKATKKKATRKKATKKKTTRKKAAAKKTTAKKTTARKKTGKKTASGNGSSEAS